MLENRDYMRNESSSGNPLRFQWSASVVLMIVLVVTFALQAINEVYGMPEIEDWLALTPSALVRGYVWQLLTFQFLHAGLWHLLGNLMGLWFFGRLVENILGTKRFLVAYFVCGVVGGLLQAGLMVLFPAHFGASVVGASAGVMGVFAIFCRVLARSFDDGAMNTKLADSIFRVDLREKERDDDRSLNGCGSYNVFPKCR